MRKSCLSLLLALPLAVVLAVDGAGGARTPATAEAQPAPVLATFAGGCFWCVEADFEKVPGVVRAVSGYTGGRLAAPAYAEVARGDSGHLEAVQVHYDPRRITYAGLLEAFWRMIDPTDAGGQFVDRGEQYTTAIFYHDASQQAAAEQSRAALARSGRYPAPILTALRPAGVFHAAEAHHQDYHRRNPLRYRLYRFASGRDRFLARTWGDALALEFDAFSPAAGRYRKPPEADLRARLSPLQFEVTQNDATERPFDNAYWDDQREGIYVDVVSGEPLFSSRDKFASGTGWPSFTRPLDEDLIVQRTDFRLIYPRTEVRSRYADSHLGHLFDDGPAPSGLRYCINSAALRFVAREDLRDEGYGRYAALFD